MEKGKDAQEALAELFSIINFERGEMLRIVEGEEAIKVIIDERLREVGVGKFEGRPDHEMTAFREGNGFANWHHKSPGGIESFDSLKKRVFSAIKDFHRKYKGKKFRDGPVEMED